MAFRKHPLVEQSIGQLVSDAADASKPYVVTAIFLRPRAGDGTAPPAPLGNPVPILGGPDGVEAEFKGWAGVPRLWPEWVDKLRRRHEPLWRQLGILGGILASTCRVRRRDHDHELLQLAPFWSEPNSTFVFPWGEATVTLNDINVLAGLPLFGVSVHEPVSDSLEKDVAVIEAVRVVLNRSRTRKPTYSAWVKHFLESALEEEAPPSAAGGGGGGVGDGEARELVEHGAFLAMWLALFVLPAPPFDVVRREVLPIAARLARGRSVALAPAALAAIYHDLSALKHRITSGKNDEPFVVSAPAHVLQLWVWEHFTQLRPEPVASSAPAGDLDIPRAARWHEAAKKLSSKDVHEVFMSPQEFQWRPYGNRSLFGLQPQLGGFWSKATHEELFSLMRCLHACELVGMNCIQQYNPHRVARQLGFDQDIPGTVPRASSGWEEAWETYNIDHTEISGFVFPKHKPSVSVQYAKWWKSYSSACDNAIAAAKMKDDFVGPAKRMGGVPNEEMDTCIVTGDIDNTNKVPNENFGSLNFSEKGNGDILMSNQELEYPMEHSAGASRKKSGNSDRFSTRPLDGNTELVSHEVCTKTLYYLSRFDRMKDAWDKDANKLPRRAVGTMEMIQKASAIRQAEMAELKKEINTLKEEIRVLEAAERGKSPE